MLLLPIRSTRALLRSFWLTLSLGLGAVAGLALPLFGYGGGQTRLLAALGVAAAVAVPGLVFPYEVALLYRGWNWAVRQFSLRAIRYVTAVCFWTVGLALSRGASSERFSLSPAGGSGWKARGTQAPEAYASQHHTPLPASDRNWTGPLYAWMRASGPPLAWTLLPFLALIRMLDTGTEQSESAAANIYTLY